MKINIKLIWFLGLLLLNSCTIIFAEPTNQPIDNSWLQKLACKFPCWQQITPQKTSFDDVMPILSEANIPMAFTGRNEKEIDFQFQDTIAGSISGTSNGVVDHIILGVHYQEITLGDLEELIGQPEKVNIVKSYSGNKCEPRLLFQTQGIIVDLIPIHNHSGFFSDVLDCKVIINMNTLVYRIILTGDFDDSEIWRNGYSRGTYMEWNGYGTYLNYSN